MPQLFGQITRTERIPGVLTITVDSTRGDARELGLVGELTMPRAKVAVGFDHATGLDKVTLPIDLARELGRSTQPCD